MEATLSKWGNSQALRVPKELCDLLGLEVGARANIEANQENLQLIVTFEQPERKYHRTRKVKIEELCAGWTGGKVGEEWGGPDVGAEVVL